MGIHCQGIRQETRKMLWTWICRHWGGGPIPTVQGGGGGVVAQGLGVGLLAAPTGLSPLCPGLES